MTERPNGRPPAPPGRVPLRRRPGWAWIRLFRPVALLVGVAVGLGMAWTIDGSPDWHELLRVGLIMTGLMAAASAFNDAAGADLDRNAYVWRPIPAGFLTPRQATQAAALAALVAIVAAASLDWRALLLVLLTIAALAVYSALLKGTPFSWLAWSLSFALLPLWIAEGVDAFDGVLWWSFPVGGLAGLAAFCVIKLPDYERDDELGARNVLHWMTIDYAVPITWGAVGSVIVVAVASANAENLREAWIIPSATTAIVLALTIMGLLFFGVTERRLVWQRWALSLALVAMALGWLGSIVP